MAGDPACEFYFSPIHVIDYCRFAETMKHLEPGSWHFTQARADGTVDDRIILEPWQIWAEAAIQGFRRSGRGDRLVRTALEVVPRKNAKSLKATVAVLYDLCISSAPAEIPIGAATMKQSKDTVFGDLVKMCNNDPELIAQYGLKVKKEEIWRGDGRVFLLTSQGERQDGLNPSLALFEEGHAGARSVYSVIESAFGARPNALKRMITTAGYSPEGPGWDLWQDAKLILEGKAVDYTLFAAIYTLDKELYINPDTHATDYKMIFGNIEDLVWRANPMMGVSLDEFSIQADINKAERSVSDRREFLRTRLNLWVGSGSALVEAAAWAACQRKLFMDNYFGRKCWIGVDLAQVLDMCAVVLMFQEPGGQITVFPKFYLPASSPTVTNPDLSDHIHAWRDAGHIELTEGAMADHDLVRDDVLAFCEHYEVEAIACDTYQAHNTVKHLWDKDRPVFTFHNNAPCMTAPWDDIEGRIASQMIWHDGNPVMSWCMGNVHGDRKGNGLILPRKETKSSVRKIDGVVAACYANAMRLESEYAKPYKPDEAPIDPYKQRGLIGFEERVNG